MRNPIMDYLRGKDLQGPFDAAGQSITTYDGLVRARDGDGYSLLTPPAAKGLTLPDAAFNILRVEYTPPLIHGPGTPPWGERGGYDFNSAVFACLRAIADAYVEAPLRVYREADQADRAPQPNHPLQGLINRPNAFMDWRELEWWWTWVKNVDGNAYLRKLRSGNETTGNVVELWPTSPTRMKPVTTKEDFARGVFISYYAYDYGGSEPEKVPVENIIHLKLGIDDQDHRLGLAPIKRLVREVAGDEEASRWAAAMLANGGAAGMIVTTPDGASFTKEQAEDLKARLKQEFGGDQRGATAVLAPGASVEQYGATPDKMDMRTLHYIPETRVAAVMRVPAVVAGLSAGLEKSGQYSNFKEAREQFTESTILPAYQFDAAKLNHSLVPDFTTDPRIVVDFDVREMRVLQEDQDALFKRLQLATGQPFMAVNEARARVGLDPVDGGDELAQPAPPPALPDAQQPPANLPPGKARGVKALSRQDFPDLLRALVDLAEPQMEADVQRYFASQKRRVQRALEEQAG